MMVPSERSPEVAALQGKSRQGPGSAPFGGRNGLAAGFAFCSREKYSHNGGMALATNTVG
jgi:hypothetical protein